jgi:hypothetical protein
MKQGSSFVPFGVQSGLDDEVRSSFAVSMVYDVHSGEVVITGGTYSQYFSPDKGSLYRQPSNTQSDCFVGLLKLPQLENIQPVGGVRREPEWIRRRQFGNRDVSEFCSGLQVGPLSNMYVIGHSQERGLLSNLLPDGSTSQSVYGMIIELNDDINLWGGQLLHTSRVQYPVQMTADPTFRDFFVVSLFADADPANILVDSPTSGRVYRGGADLSATGYQIPLYGRQFSARVQRMYNTRDSDEVTAGAPSYTVGDNSTVVPETVEAKWTRDYGTDTLDSVEVSGLIYLDSSALILAGYTKGSGPSFGYTDLATDTTLDGFVTKINPENGEVIVAKRISSVMKRSDDRILGICHHESTDEQFLFVVGMTEGLFDDTNLPEGYPYDEGGNDAFILKLDLTTMEIVWSRQLGAFKAHRPQFANGHQIHGMACTVTADGELVYMAGDIKDGAIMSVRGEIEFVSAGADDIFVAQFRTIDGALQYARQIGSPEDDTLAQGNSLSTDRNGNLIVLGNTRGGLFREKGNTGVSDLFSLSVGRLAGEHVGMFEGKKEPAEDDIVSDAFTIPVSNTSVSDLAQAKKYIVIGIVLGVSIIFIGIALILCRCRKSRALKNSITMQLQEMDAVDIVLEASSVRGWQAVLKEKGLGNTLEEFRGQPVRQTRSGGGYGAPWNDGDTEDDSLTNSLVLQSAPREIDDSDSLLTRTRGNFTLGDEGMSSEFGSSGLPIDDPLYFNDEDPYDEIYGMLSEANERLMRQTKSRKGSNRETTGLMARSVDEWDSEII